MKKNSTITIVLITLLALIWGSSFILMKKSVTVFSPLQIAAIRIFSAFVCFVPVLIINIKKLPSKKDWGYIFLTGLLGSLLPGICFGFAISRIDSSLSSVLNSLTPIFTLLVGYLFYKNQISKNQFWGMMTAFTGSILLVLAKSTTGISFSINPWSILIILATVMYGFNVNILKTNLSHIGPLVLAACMLATVGPIAGIILLKSNFADVAFLPTSAKALSYTILLGVMGTGAATILFNWLLQITTPVLSSSVTYLVPIVAIFWGLLDNEVLFLQHYVGIVLILIGVYWVNKN